MVCGLCHRESTDHSLSTSGPTRCEYTTHREDCPGGFKSNCFEHNEILSEKQKEKAEDKEFIENKETNNAMNDLLTALKALDIKKNEQSNALSKDSGHNALEGLGLTPDQVQATLGLQIGQLQGAQKTSPAEVPETFKTPFPPNDTPAPAGSTTPSNAPSFTTPLTPSTMLAPSAQGSASSLAGIEALVRQHISSNQQNLQQVKNSQENLSAYTGPTLTEIRQDPSAQQEVAKLIDGLKLISPVFGQLTSNPTPTTAQGVSPLDRSSKFSCHSNSNRHLYTSRTLSFTNCNSSFWHSNL